MQTPSYLCWDNKTHMAWLYDDGGREAAGFKGQAQDCVIRSIAIAANLPYKEVCFALNELAIRHERVMPGRPRSSSGQGIRPAIYKRYLEGIGWEWHPTMFIGSGAKVHLCEEELPLGRLIVQVSKHVTVVIDRVLHDTYDCQRDSIVWDENGQRIVRRCVYGYFMKKED